MSVQSHEKLTASRLGTSPTRLILLECKKKKKTKKKKKKKKKNGKMEDLKMEKGKKKKGEEWIIGS